MYTQRQLNKDEAAELDRLNKEVASAIAKRRDWLDGKMLECSELKPGDELFDLNTGRRLGVVSKLYRYWRDRDEGVRDTGVSCDYEFCVGGNCYDNTSRQPGLYFGTKQQAANAAKANYERLAF